MNREAAIQRIYEYCQILSLDSLLTIESAALKEVCAQISVFHERENEADEMERQGIIMFNRRKYVLHPVLQD